jgi:hypothetical protein
MTEIINEIQRKVLCRAILKYGTQMQQMIVVEELSELQKAIIKQLRKPTMEHISDITEEMADCYIMLEQLRLMYVNDKEIEKQIERKVMRLNQRLLAKEKEGV